MYDSSPHLTYHTSINRRSWNITQSWSPVGQEREIFIAPEISAHCQKRETFPVVSHSSSPSFSTQLLKKMAEVKRVKSPQDFMSSSLSFLAAMLPSRSPRS